MMESKQKYWLYGILISAAIGIIFIGGCIQRTEGPTVQPFEQLETKEGTLSDYKRKNITFVKFVSSENCMYFFDRQEIAELKSLNINGIRICPLYSLRADGSLREEIPSAVIIDLIKRAHKEGFAVFLEPNLAGPTGFPRFEDAKYIDDSYSIALHWARIAEEENVEFYSPLNEPNAVFTKKLVGQWITKSQDLKHVFSGNLVLKFAGIGPEKIENISKYDYLAFDIMWGDNRYNELKSYLDLAIEKGSKLKKKYLKGFFFGELGAERSKVDKNVQTEIFRTIFESTWNKVDGYCFLGWSDLEFRFRDNDNAKEIIKDWYAKRDRA